MTALAETPRGGRGAPGSAITRPVREVVYLRVDRAAALRKLAEADGRSVSAIIRIAIDRMIDAQTGGLE